MKIILDEQDVIDSVHVYIASQGNRRVVEGSEPHNVYNVELFYDGKNGFSAKGYTYGTLCHLDQQDFINAIALYMSSYYSFASNRLMINLAWDEATKLFGADIIVER
ncbi:DUF2653 family protein [Paenibacillus sp. GP183]|jgi:hypothetical protein|uniref:DUF2653 family protein n=1 Tax=Paenibacillus sp. GP183 TaxID=1882751 RepID=UPI00089789A3|nr:DUF2653 family protein [Paenibacillus sp. GP183]SEC09147.1 Protein of unknown function [Paenibacillus sp. GP183]